LVIILLRCEEEKKSLRAENRSINPVCPHEPDCSDHTTWKVIAEGRRQRAEGRRQKGKVYCVWV